MTLILGDLMVMKYCQLDSLLVWFAFLGFAAIPPKWVMNPPNWLGWLGKYSLRIYGLSFLPFLLKWSAVWTFATLRNSVGLGFNSSGRGGLNHGGVANDVCWRVPAGLNLFAQKCDRVLAGRAPGGVAPLWEQFIVIGTLWSVGLQDAQEH